MITDKKFSLQLLRAVLKRGRGLPDHHVAHPEREWLIGLSIALLALIAGTLWSVQLYFSYADIKPVSVELNDASEQVYRSGDVARSLEALRERKGENDLLKQQLQTRSRTPSFITIEDEASLITTPEATSTEDLTAPEETEGILEETEPIVPNLL